MKTNKNIRNLLLFVLLAAAAVMVINQHSNRSYFTNEGRVFGTTYHITYQADRDLHQVIREELQRVDNSLSPFNANSTITRLNNNEQTATDKMLRDVLLLSYKVEEDTHGAFDITVAPLVNAWGFGFKNNVKPTEQAIDSMRAFVGFKKLDLGKTARQVKKSDPRLMLDCSAVAKGYAVDCIAALLRKWEVENYMVEIGGEIVVAGHNKKGNAWTIGVAKPQEDSVMVSDRQPLQTTLTLTDRAMATSGNYRNYRYEGTQKVAHTIDPRTGYPVQHSLLSATVFAANCATADAYATAFMVVGADSAKQILARHPEMQALLVTTDSTGRYLTEQIGKIN